MENSMDMEDDSTVAPFAQPSDLQISVLDCKDSLLDNLAQLFNDSNYSDVTLIVGARRYPAHKTILVASSSFFKRMFFGGEWIESKGTEVKLEEAPACEEVFETFLRYFYNGTVSVNRKTVVAMVTLADKYDVVGLKNHCTMFMTHMLNGADIEGALAWLSFAELMSLPSLSQRCYEIICCNFEKASSFPGWLTLSLTQILALLKRSDIVVSSEYNVFMGIQRWLLSNENIEEMVSEIYPHIQFKNMSVRELCQIEESELANGIVADLLKQFILEAFRYVAVREKYPEGSHEPATCQRWYTGETFKAVNFVGNIHLHPTCTWSSEPSNYAWELGKDEMTGLYHIRLPRVSHPNRGSTYALYNRIRGSIEVQVQFLFRDEDAVVHHVFCHNATTMIPRTNGGKIVVFPDFGYSTKSSTKREFIPHDLLYSFILEQA